MSDDHTFLLLVVILVIARNAPFHIMYKILIGLAAWFAIVACHYMFFRNFVQKVVDKFIAPDKYRSGAISKNHADKVFIPNSFTGLFSFPVNLGTCDADTTQTLSKD